MLSFIFIIILGGLFVSGYIISQSNWEKFQLKLPTILGSIMGLTAFLLLPLLGFVSASQIETNLAALPEAEFYPQLIQLAFSSPLTNTVQLGDVLFTTPELTKLWQLVQQQSSFSGVEFLLQLPIFNQYLYGLVAAQLGLSLFALISLVLVINIENPTIDLFLTNIYGIIAMILTVAWLWYLPVIDNLGDKTNFFLSVLLVLADGQTGWGLWFILLSNLLLAFNAVFQQGMGYVGQTDPYSLSTNTVESRLPTMLVNLVGGFLLIITSVLLATRLMVVEQPPASQLAQITATTTITNSTPIAAIATIAIASTDTPVATSQSIATVTPTPTALIPPKVSVVVSPPDLAILQQQMLEEINHDRALNNASPVSWDDLAMMTAQDHVVDMAEHDFFSHWDLNGYGPDHRYAQKGGRDLVAENLHFSSHTFDDGTANPIKDWVAEVTTAQQSLMNSPGHRRTIVNPAHTHVGIGMAYNPETGKFYLAQEFISRYLQLEPLPFTAKIGEVLTLKGTLLPGSGAIEPLINLAFEPIPSPMTLAELAQTGSYSSTAIFFQALEPTMITAQEFETQMTLTYEAKAGFYHVRIFVSHPNFAEKIAVSDVIIEVQ